VHVNATCGGSGVCGKCRVVVESGAVAYLFGVRAMVKRLIT